MTTPSIETVLTALCGAIECIDGGCSYCIEAFADNANKALEDIGVLLIYRYTDDETVVVETAIAQPKMPECRHCRNRHLPDERGFCMECGKKLEHSYIMDYFTEGEKRWVVERLTYHPGICLKSHPKSTDLSDAVWAVLQ